MIQISQIKKFFERIIPFLSIFSIFVWIKWGFWWFCGYWLILGLFHLCISWDSVKLIMDMAEVRIFGKTLDRENWQKGEINEKFKRSRK